MIRTLLPCAALLLRAAGPTQPQSTEGACQVIHFFLVALGTSNTDMTIDASGKSCTFTVINPDLQAIQTAALITRQPEHGRAEAGLVDGNRSAAIRYTPAPGYTGPDRFSAIVEPAGKSILVAVTVGPAR